MVNQYLSAVVNDVMVDIIHRFHLSRCDATV